MAKTCFKTVFKPPKVDFRQLRPKFQNALSHRKGCFTMKMNHFKTVIMSDWRIILQNTQIFFLTYQRTITSLSFPIGISYWENRIHLGALIFGSQNFPVSHMFLKYRSRENENEFKKHERGFFSQQTSIKNPLLVYTHVSHI